MAYPVFANGDVLNASDMNAVGLWLVKSQTIGTGVSSVTVSDAFSATYDSYRIVLTGVSCSTAANVGLSIGASSTNYYGWMAYGAATVATVNGINNNNTSNWPYIVGGSASGLSGWIEIHNPFLAVATYVTSSFNSTASMGIYNGYHSAATSYSSFTLTPVGATLTGGTVSVYGYRK